ncbi:hypothetical protein [Methylobacterium bullatum]|uniref:Uncharacterized protein n=1 Tax=Methylobacterium bullatum TaxID=570505 RepID=A0AAV4Z190_9HYPH|nr:hypothetical protein [Methylobacterium bullatum]MBD8904187.1 hypothetical protein [Methylobacterium bullatum]GJD37747.1 hypothetical protein OICFNHDK_0185 [Methylobacterium bullatum]
MADEVTVQPVRTYLEGMDLKEPHHGAYPVSRSRALELRGNGLVTFEDAAPEPVPSEPEPDAQKSRGRRQRPA